MPDGLLMDPGALIELGGSNRGWALMSSAKLEQTGQLSIRTTHASYNFSTLTCKFGLR